ncbi:MAG TPA: ATP-binding protein, partial [bacterium]|nr:ATP-binding protein [bacterium]
YQHHVWQPYGPGEGIPPAAVYSLYEDSRGRIWAGSESGVFLYHPEADRDPPQTFIAEETMLYQQEIRIGRNLRIDYSGRDRWMQTPDEQLLFSCRVDGTGWSPYVSGTIFSSTDFTAGAHRFEVKALDKNMNADPAPAAFRFYVYPVPWQEQRWFLPAGIGVLLVIGALAVSTYFARLRVLHYATNLESMVKARTEELRKTELNVLEISEREQQRIGQELHDGVVQDLTGAIFLGEIVHDDLQPGSSGLSQQMEKMIAILESTREQTRELAKGLSPVNVQKTALMSSLLELCEHVRQIYNIPCELICPQSIAIEDPQISLNLYRIAQEAVNNALKHAQAGKIVISLRNEKGNLILSVEDDGTGMTGFDGKPGRMGMSIMRYRANRIHAQWSIQSEPSRGTKVSCTLPRESM